MSVIRTFGIQSIDSSSASQPCFGTTLAADGALSPDQFAGNPATWTAPGTNPSLSYFQVVSSLGFYIKDRVVLAPKANFAIPANALPFGGIPTVGFQDTGYIAAITPGSPYDIITVQGLVKEHFSGEYFVLNEPANAVYIVPRVTTGLLYIGNASSVSATDVSVFDVIPIYAGTGVPYFHKSIAGAQYNPFQLMEFWLRGASGDTFTARWVEV